MGSVIIKDPNILGGEPVFRGTRVPCWKTSNSSRKDPVTRKSASRQHRVRKM
jgi:hypothetical protein